MIGISINVDAKQVDRARRSIEEMNGSLRQTEDLGAIGIDEKRLGAVSGLVARVTEDIRRLQGLAAEGRRRGGLIDSRQLLDAEKINSRLLESFGSYSAKVAASREEIKKLITEKDRLVKIEQERGRLDPFERQRLGQLDETIAARLRTINRHSARADEMRTRMLGANEDLGGFGVQGPGGDFNAFLAGAGLGPAMARLKKFATAGGGLAALAALPIASYASDALSGKATAERFARQESEMWPRTGGAPGLLEQNRGSHGYGPLEHLALADTLNKAGNLRRFDLLDVTEGVKTFSRGRGIDAMTTANYAGAYSAFSGADGRLLNQTLAGLRDALVLGEVGGRSEEFMNRNLQVLGRIAESQGGAISPGQAAFLTSMQAGMWSGDSPVGKGSSGQNIMQALDNLFRTGGQGRGTQLLMWQALGGENVKSPEDYWRMQGRMSEGLSGRNFDAVMDELRKTYGTDAQGHLSIMGRLALQSMTGLAPAQIDLLATGKGMRPGAATGSMEDDATAVLRSTRGGRDAAISAQKAANEMAIGQPLHSGAVKFREMDQDIRYRIPGKVGDMLRRPDAEMTPEDRVMGSGGAVRPLPAMPSWEPNLTPSEVRQAIEQGMDAALEKQRTRPTRVIIEGQSPTTNATGSGY